MNTLTFATRAAYIADKGSTSGSIYTALAAASNSPVSASVVSYITGTGETFIDTKNPVVEEPYGSIGDTLLYKDGKYFWLKTRAGYDAAGYGGGFYVSGALTAGGYTEIGIMVYRNGKDALIVDPSPQAHVYKTSNDNDAGIPTYGAVRIKKGLDLPYAAACPTRSEEYYTANGNYQIYLYPFPRSAWNAMMDKLASGVAGSNSESGHWSWSVAADSSNNNRLKATFTLAEGIQGTYSPEDYNNSWDEWYRKVVMVQYPPVAGALLDLNGKANTKTLCTLGTSTHPAANYCLNTKAVSGVSDFAVGKWWLPACGEAVHLMLNYDILKAKGHDMCSISPYVWTSTQYSGSRARSLDFYGGNVGGDSKTGTGIRVRAFAAYRFL